MRIFLAIVATLLLPRIASGENSFYLEAPAFPSPIHFTYNLDQQHLSPVLQHSSENSWEATDVLNPSVLRWNGKYWNYYSGFSKGIWGTGVATSTDGTNWQKYTENPVLLPRADGWDAKYIAANGSAVVIDGHINYYYQGQSDNEAIAIGLAQSSNGYDFTRHPIPVLTSGETGTWDESAVADPYVINYEGKFYLYFLGMNRAGVQRLGIAESDDGITWKKHPNNPIMDIGPAGDFDERGLGEPSVIKVNNIFLMLYTGRNDQEARNIGMAYSLDGINWRKQTPKGLNIPRQAWDAQVICDPTMLLDRTGSAIQVWYGGGNKAKPDENISGNIGYLKLLVPTSAVTGFDSKKDARFARLINGSYPITPDGQLWIGEKASLELLPPPAMATVIEVSGYAPFSLHQKANAELTKLTIQYLANGTLLGSTDIDEDVAFTKKLPIPSSIRDQNITFSIKASHIFNPLRSHLGDDRRNLSVIINSIQYTQ